MVKNRNFYQEFKQNAGKLGLFSGKEREKLNTIHDLLVKMVMDILVDQGYQTSEIESVLPAKMEQEPAMKALVQLAQSGDCVKEVIASAEKHAAKKGWKKNDLDTYQSLYDGLEKTLNIVNCRQRLLRMFDPFGDCSADSIQDP